MTREEQINEAEVRICTHVRQTNEQDYHGHFYTENSYNRIEGMGFRNGAKWADEHPKHKWVNVEDDLPCNHNEFITKDGITTMPVPTISYDGLLELHNMVKVMSSKGGDRWIWEEGISPQYWFYLPDLK